MANKKKRSLDDPDQNWLVSYSDMMTLLLYLFVILYAMAVLNKGQVEQKLQEFSNSFVDTGRINIFDSSDNGDIPMTNTSGSNGKISYSQISEYIKKSGLNKEVNVSQGENGITLELKVDILFDSGSAVIKKENQVILDKISDILKDRPNNIIIKGFTDNQPIDSGYYKSNWELSSDRAIKILRYFTEVRGLKPERFEATGFGQYQPIADNSTAEGRQKNRRVEIFIKDLDENSK